LALVLLVDPRTETAGPDLDIEALGARSFGPPLRRRFFRGIQRIAMHLERFLLKFRCQAIFLQELTALPPITRARVVQ